MSHDIRTIPILLGCFGLFSACNDVDDPTDGENPEEVITTVTLTFTPQAGGTALAFTWADPENDGAPVIDPIVLPDADDYDLSVAFVNELSSPPEDITIEVQSEGDQHQVFFTGTAVEGPATGENAAAVVTHAYADTDANGFPIGLENTITTVGVGSGTFDVLLRHMPAEPDPLKTGGLAEEAATNGLDSLPGDTDVSVEFDLTVE
jgi:hypothetical protein